MTIGNGPSPPGGIPDRPTVTRDGEPLAPVIDGVKTKRVVVHLDHRGRVFEVFNHDTEYWTSPVVHSYVFTVRPGLVKGWGIHEAKEDRYCLIGGEMLVVMWDDRDGSPTRGLEQAVVLAPEGVRHLTIPRGVWHIDVNVGAGECVVMNHPTSPYDYERPDRRLLPWDTPQIPVDLTRYFPIQPNAGRAG